MFERCANQLNRIKVASNKLFYQSTFEKSKYNHSPCGAQLNLCRLLQAALPFLKHLYWMVPSPHIQYSCLKDSTITLSEVGALLANKVESSKENAFKTYMSKRISSSLFLNPTNPAEVFNIISSLKTRKSSGYDNISSFFLKSAIKVLLFPLALLFNCSFKLGMFPDCLKVAKVLPVYKSGKKTELCNYRPISILSNISKVLEKLIHIRSPSFFK